MRVGDRFNPYKLFHGSHIPNWLLGRGEVSAGAKLIYARLAQYMGGDGQAFPKPSTLAAEVGYSERGARNAVRELEKLGLLEVEDRSSQGRSSLYVFMWHTWIEEDLTPGKKCRHPRQIVPHPPAKSAALKENHLRDSEEENQQQTSSVGSLHSQTGSSPNSQGTVLDERESSAPISCEEISDTDTPMVDRWAKVNAVGAAAADKAVAQAKANRLKRVENVQRKEARADQARRNLKGDGHGAKPISKKRAVDAVERVWRSEMGDAYPDATIVRWSGKDRGNVYQMIEQCGSGLVVENTVKYVVRNWKTVSGRFKKGSSTGYPLVGWVVSLIATLAPEAETWIKHVAVLEEWDRADTGDPFAVPSDLKTRYREAKAALKGIGLG